MIRIKEVKLSLDQALTKKNEIEEIKKYLNRKYRIKSIDKLRLVKKAIDARNKNNLHFVYTIDLITNDEKRLLALEDKDISLSKKNDFVINDFGSVKLKHRPVIVGFGPSGIFASYLLALHGFKPIVLEQGLDIDSRDQAYNNFIKTRIFEKSASIQFGEGGAGTYSDGKLTTSITDIRTQFVLETLVKFGADEEILYFNRPHVGTDRLKNIVKSMRKEIIRLGGEIRFASQFTNFDTVDDEISRITVNNSQSILVDCLLLGVGHSSRDTYELLRSKDIKLLRKPFSIGLRIEHPQSLINESQYGKFANHPALGAADYKLSYHDDSGRSAYTFCMCPGGYVMCGTSEEEGVVTNGMSESKRDNVNANSAVLVNIKTDDFETEDVLAGMYFQRDIERQAYVFGGKNYNAPIQLVGDFLTNNVSVGLGSVKPSYKPGTTFSNFNDILPNFVNKTLRNAIISFDKKIKGFAMKDAILTGIESRSSSPIRIIRNDNFETNIKGVYSMGEGAGYAGGIMSSAVDGIRIAETIIKNFSPA
jgi:uncharacterized FAD-dependent dehydrogenase